jgi:hypothetical protein
MQNVFTIPFHIQGTLAANHYGEFKLPMDAQLIAVSVCNSTANAGKIDVGTSADDDAYLDNQNFGVSNVPLVYDRDDFVGTQFPHIAAGTIIRATITDHASHMAGPLALLVFTEG